MVQSITNNYIYRTTDKIETNTLLNRGIVEIFGYATPMALNANNKDEARERIMSSAVYSTIAFLSPCVTLPMFNKILLKKAGITDSISDKGVEIVRLSKKYLVKDSQTMLKGIDELKKDLKEATKNKTREKFKNIDKDFQKILDKFPNKEVLRTKLLKTHTKIALADYISTGSMFILGTFGYKELTKKLTKRTGFSAEYKMADEDYTKKNAQKHEKNKKTKILLSTVLMLVGSIACNKFIEKSFFKQNTKGAMKWIHNNAEKFDYTDGKFMKILPYFLISLVGDWPSYWMSARDKYELRDSIVRTAASASIFFGGGTILNGLFGRIFDKTLKTRLVNKENINAKSSLLAKATAPIYTLEELRKKTNWDENLLKRTQKIGIGMYWLNLALVILILGIGLPKTLNHVLKNSVNKDIQEKSKQKKEPQNM